MHAGAVPFTALVNRSEVRRIVIVGRVDRVVAADGRLRVRIFPSALGWMGIAMRGDALCQVTFGNATPIAAREALDADFDPAVGRPSRPMASLARRLQALARGEVVDFGDVVLDLSGQPPFARRVVELCRRIPFGHTLTYGELAAQAGSPRAARAVGNVMRSNCCPLVVPCHRVVASGGVGGYSAAAGVRTKLRLLEQESLVSV
jgi:methylated-DNA-[protein]-cysteine S-methyltransferase